MPKLITRDSDLKCPHGGTVEITPAQTRATAGTSIATTGDGFDIRNCNFAVGGAPHPCIRIEWMTKASRVTASNEVLTDACVGMCFAADGAPQGTVLINAQQKADGL
jgi:hypothetical protein